MSKIVYKHTANQEWYRLDNAATLYTLISSHKSTCMFRIEACLKRAVNINKLQLALDNIIERFPYYRVNLMRGLFWHFWNTNLARPRIIADSECPCEQMPLTRKGIFPFRVRVYKNRVAMEFHHSITDGSGGLIFLQALLAEYFGLKGLKVKKTDVLFRTGQTPKLSEYEDAYKKYYKKSIPSPLKQSKVFSLPFKASKSHSFFRTTGVIELKNIKAVIKELKVSITEFLSAVFLYSFQDILLTISDSKRKTNIKPIRILVPVNLRKIYSSNTMRNFSLYVNPKIDPRLGQYNFSDILKEIYHYMRVEVNERYINRQIKRNVRAELHPLLRVTPLFLKKIILRTATSVFFSSVNNGVLSNLGRIEMPPPLDAEINNFQFLLPPSRGVKICLAISSYKEKMYLNFARIHRESEVEKHFFRKLVKMGIKVKII
jgi:NRPS condensation-like uncharacterized protein